MTHPSAVDVPHPVPPQKGQSRVKSEGEPTLLAVITDQALSEVNASPFRSRYFWCRGTTQGAGLPGCSAELWKNDSVWLAMSRANRSLNPAMKLIARKK